MNTTDTQQIVLWVAVGFIAGVLVTTLAVRQGWMGSGPTKEHSQNETEQPVDENGDKQTGTNNDVEIGLDLGETVISETARVDAQDQPAGDTATALSVVLGNEGWVVVHEIVAGQITNALGAARRSAGAHEEVMVRLLRGTEPAREYAIMLYEDDGDGTFDLRSDLPVLDTDMNPVIARFETTEPEEEAAE